MDSSGEFHPQTYKLDNLRRKDQAAIKTLARWYLTNPTGGTTTLAASEEDSEFRREFVCKHWRQGQRGSSGIWRHGRLVTDSLFT
jgi:hypothetical protein